MCGIAGVINLAIDNKLTRYDLKSKMYHRGPDHYGEHHISNKLSFYHSRLSIVDLSPESNQPMLIDNKLIIAFNGEIYNFKSIRNQLKGNNQIFQTKSDTEVLARAYLEYGVNCLEFFNGMFSFVIYDLRDDSFFAARDRIGIKPFYYFLDKSKFVFASEIKQIKSLLPATSSNLSATNVLNYFYSFTTINNDTFLRNIKRLGPGSYIHKTNDNVIKKKYWCPLINSEMFVDQSNLENHLANAVSIRKPDEVDFNVFLSGGVDSSLINKFSNSNYSAGLSIEYQDSMYQNENKFAKFVAGICNTEHCNIKINEEELKSILNEYEKYADIPIGDPVSIAIFILSKFNRKSDIKVALVGEGADEIFHGYESWIKIFRASKIANLFGKLGLRKSYFLGDYFDDMVFRARNGLPAFAGTTVALRYSDLKHFFGHRNFETWLNMHFESLRQDNEYFKNNTKNQCDSIWMKYLDLITRLPEVMLSRLDLFGMANSLETRVPFLDHSFVQKYFYTTFKDNVYRKQTKIGLRKISNKYFGHDISYRKKQGFDIQVQDLKSTINKNTLNQMSDFYNDLGLIDGKLEDKLDRNNRKRAWWLFFSLFNWHKTWS